MERARSARREVPERWARERDMRKIATRASWRRRAEAIERLVRAMMPKTSEKDGERARGALTLASARGGR